MVDTIGVDSNIFIHAMIELKRELNEAELKAKQNSKKILLRIQAGENVFVTTLQIAEIMSVIERWQGHEIARDIFEFLLEAPNVKIFEITQNELSEAMLLAEKYKHNNIGINDLVTYVAMKKANIDKIYSIDRYFDQFRDITRLEK